MNWGRKLSLRPKGCGERLPDRRNRSRERRRCGARRLTAFLNAGLASAAAAPSYAEFAGMIPLALSASAEDGGVVNIPAALICLLVTFILSRGTKAFGRFELVAG